MKRIGSACVILRTLEFKQYSIEFPFWKLRTVYIMFFVDRVIKIFFLLTDCFIYLPFCFVNGKLVGKISRY